MRRGRSERLIIMSNKKLFSPITLGDIELKNRVLMAPMTRARTPSRVPNDSTVTYYAQRAGAGPGVGQ